MILMAAIGELVLDVTIAPEGPWRVDDDQDAQIKIAGGGQAANFCAWAASLGEPARLLTRIGDDAVGHRLVAELELGGVEVRAVIGEEPTGVIAVLVGPEGERTFARQRGASTLLRPEQVREEWVEGVRLLHIPGYALFLEPLGAAARRAAELVRARGGLISVDLSSSGDLDRHGAARMAGDLLALAPELLFATEREVAALAPQARTAAKILIVKLGRRGCTVMGRRIPAPVVEEVDPTGAGDAFAAAFCAAYLEGSPPLEAGGRAVLVAARAVTRLGARP
jgi:sugar/nucleoside kinase (ribokinase family)